MVNEGLKSNEAKEFFVGKLNEEVRVIVLSDLNVRVRNESVMDVIGK